MNKLVPSLHNKPLTIKSEQENLFANFHLENLKERFFKKWKHFLQKSKITPVSEIIQFLKTFVAVLSMSCVFFIQNYKDNLQNIHMYKNLI